MKTIKWICLLLLCVILLQGCVAAVVGAGAGAGAVAYIKGELQTTYAAPLSKTWDAAMSALKELEITVVTTQMDATRGTIEASRADGSRVKIDMKATGIDTTSVSIRVGILGDQAASRTINDKIAANLEKK